MLEEAGREDDVERRVADRHGERIAAEGRPVDADREAARRVRRRKADRHREARADALGGSKDVRMNAAVFISVETTGAADAGLHLVEDQQKAAPVADLAQTAQEGGRDHPHAALALDRLDHDRGRLRPDRRLDRGEVGDRDLVEAVDLGTESFEIFFLAARGDRGEGAAVESALEGQHPIALGMAADPLATPRHLDRRLVRLRPGIGEEHQIGEGGVGKAAGVALAFRILVEVRHVPDLRALAHQGLDEVRMGVADRGHRDAGAEVEIALAGRRDEPAALAALEGDIGPRVGRHDR